MNFTESPSRRLFLRDLSLATGALLTSSAWLEAFAKKGDVKIGYSAITWGGKDEQAIADLSSLGYKGIQLRANTFAPYRTRVSELKDALVKHNLTLAMFSSGNVEIDPAKFQAPWIRTLPTPVL